MDEWRQPITEKDFLSGFFSYKHCDWNLCIRYPRNFDISTVKDNDSIFLNLDHIYEFISFLDMVKPNAKFTLVTQNSDNDFTLDMYNRIEQYVNKIYAINCNFSGGEKMVKVPIGFNDHSTEVLENQDFTFVDKTNFAYMNFRIQNHHSREHCYNYFTQFDWVNVEYTELSQNDFYTKLKSFKYCISPRGTGIDTHRLYEALLYGVIPVVVKSELDDLYSKFPILVVDQWEDVTYDFLNDNYQQNLSNYFKWFEENPNWYKTEYWLK